MCRGANTDRIREELSQMNILVEEWGGKYQAQEISAKKGLNIDELLDKVLLEAELLELKANPDKRAKGTVMEAKLDKGRGITASLLVQEGTLDKRIQESLTVVIKGVRNQPGMLYYWKTRKSIFFEEFRVYVDEILETTDPISEGIYEPIGQVETQE